MSGTLFQANDTGVAPAVVLRGRIVTMDEQWRVLDDGALCLQGGRISAVLPWGAPRPAGFEAAPVLSTRSTLYPGLIELHNHLPYNVLRLWDVPERYQDRGQWGRERAYDEGVRAPMRLLAAIPNSGLAIARYTECKCLVAGVTTSQGVTLANSDVTVTTYRGLVRNVEQSGDPELPRCETQVADVGAGQAADFLGKLSGAGRRLLHLAEGLGDTARRHFLHLQLPNGEWAITNKLVGIHANGLRGADLQLFGARGGKVVWSPTSNYLLYGGTTDISTARAAGVPIALGSDWSPTGSKNLLFELKTVAAWSDLHPGVLRDRDIVAMATRDAAKVLGWEGRVGVLAPGARADLLMVSGKSGDPYARLLDIDEQDIRAVFIEGWPRYGTARWMTEIGATGESLRVGGARRVLASAEPNLDPPVPAVSLSNARDLLREALGQLPEIATRAADPTGFRSLPRLGSWCAEIEDPSGLGASMDVRTLPPGTRADMAGSAAAQPLDALAVADDADYRARLLAQRNLPPDLREALKARLKAA